VMSVLKKDIRGQAIWQERFFVLARGDLSWFPVDAQLTGYDLSRPLGRIPVKFVIEATIKSDGESMFHNLLDLITDKSVYHFKSDLTRECNKWQESIMNTSPPGGERHKLKLPEIKKAVMYDPKDIFGTEAPAPQHQGGIPFDRDLNAVTPEQDRLLQNIFETIAAQDVTTKDKKFIEGLDLAKFIDNRMRDADQSEVPTREECEKAIEEACMLVNEPGNNCSFEAFKVAICKKVDRQENPHGSEMARIIKLAMGSKAEEETFKQSDSEIQEMTVGQKLYEYHKFMGNTKSACADGSTDGAEMKISLTRTVAESYLDNIVREVEALQKRHQAYQQRIIDMQPTLRARNQWNAVDDVFDHEMLPGERWDRDGRYLRA